MRKHPGILAFVVTAVILLVYLVLSLGNNKNVDASTWIMAFGFGLFPFVWFLVWIIFSTINWFRDAADPSASKSKDD